MVKLLGLTITRTSAVDKIRAEMRMAASQRLKAELNDRKSEISQVVARVARSAAKDHFEQLREDQREAFEGTSEFQDWARQRREHDLAQAEKSQPEQDEMLLAVPPFRDQSPAPMPSDALMDSTQLRYAILGLLATGAGETLSVIRGTFSSFTKREIDSALALLMADGLVREERGVYAASGRPQEQPEQDGQGNADSDSQ